jgi:hypothetical protein
LAATADNHGVSSIKISSALPRNAFAPVSYEAQGCKSNYFEQTTRGFAPGLLVTKDDALIKKVGNNCLGRNQLPTNESVLVVDNTHILNNAVATADRHEGSDAHTFSFIDCSA